MKLTFLTAVCLLLILPIYKCEGQSDISFTYKGKPVSPEALFSFFPGYYNNPNYYDSIVDLDTCKTNIVSDTSVMHGKTFITYSSANGINTESYPHCDINYTVSYNYKNTYVVGADLCGNWKGAGISYYFFLTIQGNELLRLGSFKPSGNEEFRFVGQEVIDGIKHYKIPLR